jgi:hypothetical protein
MKLVMAFDFFIMLLLLCLHIAGNVIFPNPRERVILFKFCYLAVTIHILCAFYYLDLPREVMHLMAYKAKSLSGQGTFVREDVSHRPESKSQKTAFTYNSNLEAIDKVLEEYFKR